jgi:hypothetical protein
MRIKAFALRWQVVGFLTTGPVLVREILQRMRIKAFVTGCFVY